MSEAPLTFTHPKDGLIADCRALDQPVRADFSDQLMEKLFGSGFSVLGKKEIELTVLALLEASGALGIRTNHELSRALGITEARVRNLLHSARLRHGINEEAFLKSRLPALMTKMSPEIVSDKNGDKIKFVVEDGYLMQALNARIKQVGGVPDGSFSKEVCVVKIDTLAEVILTLIPEEFREGVKKKLGKDWKSRFGRIVKATASAVAGEAFKTALSGGITPALTFGWSALVASVEGITQLASAVGVGLDSDG